MQKVIILILVCLCFWACNKSDPGIETHDHTIPLNSDRDKIGSVVLKINTRDYGFFSKTIFPNFPTNFWLYDSTSTQWIPKANFPGKDRLLPILVAYSNSQIYAGLSKVQPRPDLNDWFVYDLVSDLWTPKTSCPLPVRGGMEGSVTGSNIIVGCAYALDIQLCHLTYMVPDNAWSRSVLTCDSLRATCY